MQNVQLIDAPAPARGIRVIQTINCPGGVIAVAVDVRDLGPGKAHTVEASLFPPSTSRAFMAMLQGEQGFLAQLAVEDAVRETLRAVVGRLGVPDLWTDTTAVYEEPADIRAVAALIGGGEAAA